MNTILNWSLESTIVVSVLFVFYFLCFRNNTSLNLRRRLMLFILIISVLAPLIKVDVSNTNEWSESSLVTLDDRIFESVLVRESSDIDQLEATDSTIITQARSKDYKLLIYQIGIVAFACMFLSQLIRLGYILFTGNKDHIHGTLLVKHKKIKSPSSFLFAILLSENQNLNAKESDIIIEHEKQHLKQKHSVDLLLVSIIQILTWYNPLLFWIRSELKNLHEALADKAVLETIDNKEYFQTLLASTFSIHSLSLSHCFSQKHGLLKRIHLIKKQRTNTKKTMLSLVIFSILTMITVGVNVLSAQETKSQKANKRSGVLLTPAEIQAKYMDLINLRAKEEGYPEVKSKEEALSFIKANQILNLGTFFYAKKLISRFEEKQRKLEEVYPDKEINFSYLNNPATISFQSMHLRSSNPLYIGKLNDDDKEELIQLSLKDSSRVNAMGLGSQTYPVHFFKLYEMIEEFETTVRQSANYVVFYEYEDNIDQTIYNEKDVDKMPEPIGGLEAFGRAIALDVTIPKDLDRSILPKTIDFSAVITGGKQIHSVDLLTRIKGSDKKNDELYKFYGFIIKDIQEKTRTFYSWKSGIKDGKEVQVRMKISIPTKYML